MRKTDCGRSFIWKGVLPAGQATPPGFLSHYSHTVSKAHKADFYISSEGDGEYIGRINNVEEVRVGALLVGPERPAVCITNKPRKETRLERFNCVSPQYKRFINVHGSAIARLADKTCSGVLGEGPSLDILQHRGD